MPTHQGKTQTDILIGSGSDSITANNSFEFSTDYTGSVTFLYKDNAPGQDNEDSSYEIKLLDVTGSPIAVFYAEYTCDPVTGTATNVSSTRTNTFNPSPSGNNPSFPSSWSTYEERAWSISSTKAGQTFAGFNAKWRCASTVTSGYSVSHSVTTQNSGTLAFTVSYSTAGGPLTDIDVICSASTSKTGGVQLGTPSVTDDIQP